MSSRTIREVAGSTDLGRLHRVIEGVIDKRCWKVAFAYGGELRLHLGARIPYENPKLAGEKKGEWRIGTCGTAWTLFTPNGLVSSKKGSELSLQKKAKVLEGGKIISFDVSVPSNVLD